LYELTIARNAKNAKESKLNDANCQRVKIENLSCSCVCASAAKISAAPTEFQFGFFGNSGIAGNS